MTIGIMFSCVTTVNSQYRAEKIITDSISIDADSEIRIENKYGDIHISTWDKDVVRMEYQIQIEKDDPSDVEDILSRVKPSISDYGKYVIIKTDFEIQRRGFFAQLLDDLNIENFESDLEINLQVQVPNHVELDITNEFGDVVLLDWSGDLNCWLKHGDLFANADLNELVLEQNYGKANFQSIEKAIIDFKNVKMKSDSISDLQIKSQGSDVQVNVVGILNINSDKDDFQIDEIKRLKGSIKYGSAVFGQLENEIVLKLKVAELRIGEIKTKEAEVFIEQQNSEVDINISGKSFKLHANLEEGTFRVPHSMKNLNKDLIDEKNDKRIVTGDYGSTPYGNFTIEGKKGFIILREL